MQRFPNLSPYSYQYLPQGVSPWEEGPHGKVGSFGVVPGPYALAPMPQASVPQGSADQPMLGGDQAPTPPGWTQFPLLQEYLRQYVQPSGLLGIAPPQQRGLLGGY